MIKLLYIFLFSLIFSSNQFEIDDKKSSIQWKGTKSTGSYHDGLISVDNSILNIDDNNMLLNGTIIIDMNSIICTDIQDKESNSYLVKHLKNDDFFSTEFFPKSILTINKVTPIKDDNYSVAADLTIKDQTHPIDFIANIIIKDDIGLASGKIEINRAKYNIKYKSQSWYPDIGDRFINDIFELYFTLLATKKDK
ncbi:MAG: hypothetical protein CMG47_00800 [Candidatus Marinimicrobia bacterium]|nr:hypothetical protein [Candidatus Neomarinimicrobiota bacterium]